MSGAPGSDGTRVSPLMEAAILAGYVKPRTIGEHAIRRPPVNAKTERDGTIGRLLASVHKMGLVR